MTKKLKIAELAREAERTYKKAWRDANKEKIKEYNRRYWEKRAKERIEQAQSKQEDN